MSVAAVARTERAQSEYLESLSQRVRMWRLREGKSYFSMPAPLWDEAIAVARKVGLGHASRVLGLSRDELKRRMGLTPGSKADAPAAAAPSPGTSEDIEFIELPGVAATLAAPPPKEALACDAPPSTITVAEGDAMVEVISADGDRMIVRVACAQLDIASLVHRFRSGT